MTKTILFITHSTCGGVERMTLLYAKILKQAGYDCRLLISQKPSDDFELKPFIPDDLPYELIRCRYRNLFYRIPLYLLRTKPRCVFYSFPLLIPSLILSKLVLPGMKVVFRDCNMPSKHRKYQSYPAKYILRHADALIAQTEEMKQEMAAFYHVHPERITVINNPIDKSVIEQSIREKYRYDATDCVHYIAVGRICPQKDYRTLIKAFALVLEKEPKSHLDIIGVDWDMAYRKSLDALIMQLDIGRSVTFHGFQENPFKYMEAADVFVLSSVHEGLPNVMLEAMYLGKPVVVTRSIPYIAQVVHDGVNGYAVSVDGCKELAEAMIKARRLEIKEKYMDVNSNEKRIIDLFTEVLETSRKRFTI